MAALTRELTARTEGEVRFDDRARSLYATDASPYEIHPPWGGVAEERGGCGRGARAGPPL